MNYEQIEEEIKKIIKIAEKMPEKYQVKCFELLVNALLSGSAPHVANVEVETKPKSEVITKFKLPITVKAFLTQYSLSEDVLNKLFIIEDNQISPIYNIEETKVARAQIQVALLLTFENALQTSKFVFSATKTRERCQEHKCYDGHNFMQNFKNNKSLFNSLADLENVELSPDGKAELAEIITAISK